jgi:hypothetical protein
VNTEDALTDEARQEQVRKRVIIAAAMARAQAKK